MQPFTFTEKDLSADETAGLAMTGQDFPTFIHQTLAPMANQAKQNRAMATVAIIENLPQPDRDQINTIIQNATGQISDLSVNGAQ